MGKWTKLFWNQEKDYIQLASDNYKAISEHNERILSAMTLIGGILMVLLVLAITLRREGFSRRKDFL